MRDREPLRLILRARRPPLDLDDNVFRYRVLADSSIVAVRRPRGARICRIAHGEHDHRAASLHPLD